MSELNINSKRVLVLGISGMLGSMVFSVLGSVKNFDIMGTVRSKITQGFFKNDGRIIFNISAEDIDSIESAVKIFHPDYIVNCIGLIKQEAGSNDPIRAITINSLLPHHLARVCKKFDSKLIHISTDCVFSGRKGHYVEEDIPDPLDLYGMSKLMGEIPSDPNVVTFRTSFIGPEIGGNKSLLNWFLSNSSEVQGYSRAIFSGLTTLEMSRIIAMVIDKNLTISGLYHLSSKPISKFDLLVLIREVYERGAVIERDDSVIIDRSLNSSKFQKKVKYVVPEWRELISDMKNYRE
jgi:dTDP-4-dehydrorhamnose reductase